MKTCPSCSQAIASNAWTCQHCGRSFLHECLIRGPLLIGMLLVLTLASGSHAETLTADEIRQAQKECRVLKDELRGVHWYYFHDSPFPHVDADKDYVSLYFAVIRGPDGDRLSPLFFRFQTYQHSAWIFTHQIVVKDLASNLSPYIIGPPPGTVIQAIHPYGYGIYEAYDYRTSFTRAQLLDGEACVEAVLYQHLIGKKARIQYVGQREARPLEIAPGEHNGLIYVLRLYQSYLEQGKMPVDGGALVEPPVKIGFE